MSLLREYIKESLIVVPPPPSLETRVRELDQVRDRRKNPVTRPEYSDILDRGIVEVFDKILTNAGFSGWYERIDTLKNEIKPEIKFHKEHFNQPRPNELAEAMGEALDYDYLESAQTPSYPSGHTAQAFYIAHHLASFFPDLKSLFYDAAKMVAESRIDRGVHFASDNDAGKLLAQNLFNEKVT